MTGELITLQCDDGTYICADVTGTTADQKYTLEWETNGIRNYAVVPILHTRYVDGILNASYSDVAILWNYDTDNFETGDWY